MITYRKYQEIDWKAICQIHDFARPDELIGSCDPRGFIPIEQDKEVEDLKRSKKFVAIENEKIVGFVGVDEDYLAWLYVHPDSYGKGIGRELLRIGIKEIGEGAWTIVLDGNKKAIALYESEGFQEESRFDGDNNGYPCRCIKLKRQHKKAKVNIYLINSRSSFSFISVKRYNLSNKGDKNGKIQTFTSRLRSTILNS